MNSRVSLRTVLTIVAAFGALAASTTLAAAQSADGWYGGGDYRGAPSPDSYDPPDRDRPAYQDPQGRYDTRAPEDDSDDPRADDRYDPRTDARGDDREYYDRNDDRRYDDRRNYGDDRARNDRSPSDHRYDDRDYGYGAWDAPPPAAEEERLSRKPGTGAGARPYIQAVAPPVVPFTGPYAPHSVVIDTGGRKLYYVINASSAYQYPIAVGRQGFTWTGKEKVSRVVDWPDWYPPADMRRRKPELPERMLGGINNPLGVKAIYLGNTLYRIHGTNDPKSIGKAESSGCFRMLNENVLHLASLVGVGTEVTVVRSLGGKIVASAKPPSPSPSPSPSPRTPRQPQLSERLPPYPDDRRYDERRYDPYYDDNWH